MPGTIALLGLALMGCPKPPDAVNTDLLEAAPVLPSPKAGTYARVPSSSPDPVIHGLMDGLRWDASLAGAAAATAMLAVQMGDPAMARWRVREALWQAGYPFPVHSAGLWHGPHAAPAPAGLQDWLGRRDASEDVGLVRMRGRSGDLWVGFAARPRVELDPLPRTTDGPVTLVLPATSGARWLLGDPFGTATGGSLDEVARLPLRQDGEWLLEVHDARGVAASATIYVAVPLPEGTLLDWPDEGAGEAAIHSQLAELRDTYGAPQLVRDASLEQAAGRWLDDSEDPRPFAERFGVLDPRSLECEAGTIEDCIDTLVWSVEARSALLDDSLDLVGMATRSGETTRVALVLGRSP